MLKSVHIRNFRSCVDVKLEGLGYMLGLVGRNGAGKTTVLRALDWAAATALTSKDFGSAFPDADRHEALAEPQADIVICADGREYRYRVGRTISMSEPNLVLAADRESLATRSGESDTWQRLFSRIDGDGEVQVLLGDDRTHHHIEINPATATMPALASLLPESDPLQSHIRAVTDALRRIRYYPGFGVIEADLPDAHEPAEPIRHDQYERWVATLKQASGGAPSVLLRLIHAHKLNSPSFSELRDVMGREGLDLIREINVSEFSVGRRRYYNVGFVPPQPRLELSLSELSGGTRQALYLLVGLLFDESSVMLIEQPEDGIHPALLRKLIDVMRVHADPTQIILSSHSPTILGALRPEEVRLVSMDGRTRVRGLSSAEVCQAREYMENEGTLAEFLELIQGDPEAS